MATVTLENVYGHTHFHCDNCDTDYDDFDSLDAITDIEQRIAPGEDVPAGQCPQPECGALVYVVPAF